MSTIYTFKDMRESCQHRRPVTYEGTESPFSTCTHPDNIEKGQTVGFCDENVCPIIRAILDDGEEWE
jgi:hypothetical protein